MRRSSRRLHPMNIRIVPRTTGDFVFRSMLESDIPAFMSLYRLCFADRPSEKYVRWRYFNTLAGKAPTVLAFDKRVCVSSYMVWPMPLMLDGRAVKAAQSADTMTHP